MKTEEDLAKAINGLTDLAKRADKISEMLRVISTAIEGLTTEIRVYREIVNDQLAVLPCPGGGRHEFCGFAEAVGRCRKCGVDGGVA